MTKSTLPSLHVTQSEPATDAPPNCAVSTGSAPAERRMPPGRDNIPRDHPRYTGAYRPWPMLLPTAEELSEETAKKVEALTPDQWTEEDWKDLMRLQGIVRYNIAARHGFITVAYCTLLGFDENGRKFVAMPVPMGVSDTLESMKARALSMLKNAGHDCTTADATPLPNQ